MMRPKQMARIGVFHLTEAVMDVLAQQQKDGGATPAEIGQALGLHQGENPNDGYVWNALRELEEQAKVYRISKKDGGRGEWYLTDKTYEQRRDDV